MSAAHLQMEVVRVVLLLIFAFLLGSLPFGLWLGFLVRRIDVRAHGSGNLGAANVFRVLGPGWGLLTLLLDIGKGWVATALLSGCLGLGTVAAGSLYPLGGAAAAVAGHVFSPFVRWRGGKGVATAVGTFLALAPLAAIIGAAGFALTLAIARYVSVGSMVMALLFPVAAAFVGPPPPLRGWVVGLGLVLAAIIAWRHRANWVRVVQGKESKVAWRRK